MMDSNNRHLAGLRKGVVAGLGAAVLALVMAVPASAGPPNNQACLGVDIRGMAQGGAAFGGFVAGMASTTNGVGTEIQAHLAGQIPDEQLHNACND